MDKTRQCRVSPCCSAAWAHACHLSKGGGPTHLSNGAPATRWPGANLEEPGPLDTTVPMPAVAGQGEQGWARRRGAQQVWQAARQARLCTGSGKPATGSPCAGARKARTAPPNATGPLHPGHQGPSSAPGSSAQQRQLTLQAGHSWQGRGAEARVDALQREDVRGVDWAQHQAHQHLALQAGARERAAGVWVGFDASAAWALALNYVILRPPLKRRAGRAAPVGQGWGAQAGGLPAGGLTSMGCLP